MKILKTGLKFVFAVCLIFWLVACADVKLPEGYKVLCSIEGKYTVYLPHDGNNSIHTWGSKREALEYAISWEELRVSVIERKSDKYIWKECN